VLFASSITLGVVAPSSEPDGRVVLGDFCAALGEAVGVRILPHVAPSAHALASAAHAGRVHLAFLPWAALAKLSLGAGASPIAVASRGGVSVRHAAIFVSPSSPIRDAAELAGARVAWVATTSATGYLLPRAALAARGLDPNDFFAHEMFAGSHAAVARAVADRQVDAGATWVVLRGAASPVIARAGFRRNGRGDARVVLLSDPIPGDVILASRRVPGAMRPRIARAFHELAVAPATRAAVAALFRADDFAPATRAVEEIRRSSLHSA
jgi:phosphonate transport system substrate-binding protein